MKIGEKRAKLAFATGLLEEQFPVERAAKLAGLTIDEVRKLQKQT